MTLTQRRRALMGVHDESGRLPSAYQEVEWAGANTYSGVSNIKINLGYIPKTSPRLEAEILKNKGCVFGVNGTGSMFSLYDQNNNVYAAYGTSGTYIGKGLIPKSWCKIDAGKEVYINNTKKKTFSDYDWSGNTASVALMHGPDESGYRFKYAKLYDGSNLVRDLVPCYRKSDGRIGFYCLVSKQFYTNAGSNSIMAKGNDVT